MIPFSTQVQNAIQNYLKEVESNLDNYSPAERQDVLGSLAEHINEALRNRGAQASVDDLMRVLNQMDAPESYRRQAKTTQTHLRRKFFGKSLFNQISVRFFLAGVVLIALAIPAILMFPQVLGQKIVYQTWFFVVLTLNLLALFFSLCNLRQRTSIWIIVGVVSMAVFFGWIWEINLQDQKVNRTRWQVAEALRGKLENEELRKIISGQLSVEQAWTLAQTRPARDLQNK